MKQILLTLAAALTLASAAQAYTVNGYGYLWDGRGTVYPTAQAGCTAKFPGTVVTAVVPYTSPFGGPWNGYTYLVTCK